MTTRKLAGVALFCAMGIGLFIFCVTTIGLLKTVIVLAITVGGTALVILGAYLVVGEDDD